MEPPKPLASATKRILFAGLNINETQMDALRLSYDDQTIAFAVSRTLLWPARYNDLDGLLHCLFQQPHMNEYQIFVNNFRTLCIHKWDDSIRERGMA